MSNVPLSEGFGDLAHETLNVRALGTSLRCTDGQSYQSFLKHNQEWNKDIETFMLMRDLSFPKSYFSSGLTFLIHEVPKCAKGHTMSLLFRSPYYGQGVYCDSCGESVNQSDGFYHCDGCKADACRQCEPYKYVDHDGNGQDEEPRADQLLPHNTTFDTCRHCNLPRDTHLRDKGCSQPPPHSLCDPTNPPPTPNLTNTTSELTLNF